MENARGVLGPALPTFDDCYKPLEGADGLVIFTDWPEFRMPDFERMIELLKRPLVFDGRNLFDPVVVKKHGLEYRCVGRPNVAQWGRRKTDHLAD